MDGQTEVEYIQEMPTGQVWYLRQGIIKIGNRGQLSMTRVWSKGVKKGV